jgi:hypothetical protein
LSRSASSMGTATPSMAAVYLPSARPTSCWLKDSSRDAPVGSSLALRASIRSASRSASWLRGGEGVSGFGFSGFQGCGFKGVKGVGCAWRGKVVHPVTSKRAAVKHVILGWGPGIQT